MDCRSAGGYCSPRSKRQGHHFHHGFERRCDVIKRVRSRRRFRANIRIAERLFPNDHIGLDEGSGDRRHALFFERFLNKPGQDAFRVLQIGVAVRSGGASRRQARREDRGPRDSGGMVHVRGTRVMPVKLQKSSI